MPSQDEIPEYRVLSRAFFEPHTVEPGAKIRWQGAPGPHLEPLNQAARDAMEKWFNEEVDELDPRTGDPTGKKFKPRAGNKFIRTESDSAPVAPVELLSSPDADDDTANIQTLAEIQTARKSTNQRPGPSVKPSAPTIDIPLKKEDQK